MNLRDFAFRRNDTKTGNQAFCERVKDCSQNTQALNAIG